MPPVRLLWTETFISNESFDLYMTKDMVKGPYEMLHALYSSNNAFYCFRKTFLHPSKMLMWLRPISNGFECWFLALWILSSSDFITLLSNYSRSKHIWAATWQNQQNGCAPSEDSDQPGHSPSLIRVFAVRMKKPWVLSYPLSAQHRLWSDWADAQPDLSLLRARTHFVGFFFVMSAAHFIYFMRSKELLVCLIRDILAIMSLFIAPFQALCVYFLYMYVFDYIVLAIL